jgi:hypothetical protein
MEQQNIDLLVNTESVAEKVNRIKRATIAASLITTAVYAQPMMESLYDFCKDCITYTHQLENHIQKRPLEDYNPNP